MTYFPLSGTDAGGMQSCTRGTQQAPQVAGFFEILFLHQVPFTSTRGNPRVPQRLGFPVGKRLTARRAGLWWMGGSPVCKLSEAGGVVLFVTGGRVALEICWKKNAFLHPHSGGVHDPP